VAISGRLRLRRLDAAGPDPVPEIVGLVEHLVSRKQPVFGEKAGLADFAGLVWADELAEATGDDRYKRLLLEVADRFGHAESSAPPRPCDPDLRVEDMFFAAAILGRAYTFTGDDAYLDLLTGFLALAPEVQRGGLFWHCRSSPFFWGRGNGFAALGFAEALTALPRDHPERAKLLEIHRLHLRAVCALQAQSGMFRQVLDFAGSYEELSATCMFGYAMARGLRMGWLDDSFRGPLQRAWGAASLRTDDNGGLTGVCAGTGPQKTLQAYLDRPALSGLDDRGGSLALWFATEVAALQRA
jgi:rhamnogalacturonyl hydrolase YesR